MKLKLSHKFSRYNFEKLIETLRSLSAQVHYFAYYFACGIFVDLHKAFDTVDHGILLNKLCHYGICRLTNKWFESYLANHRQFVSINGFASSTSSIASGVPQGSVLGPLLFLLYINDLHVAIKHCKVHHFADETNLLVINKSLKRLKNS